MREERVRIENWITEGPVTVKSKDSLGTAVKRMAEKKIGAVLVMDDEKLAGIFSERDLLALFSSFPKMEVTDHLNDPIEGYMTANPITAQKDEDYNTVYTKMRSHNIRHIPVLEGEKCVGVVSMRDLLHFYQNKLESAFLDAQRELHHLSRLVDLSSNEKLHTLVKEIDKYKELSLTDHLTGLYNLRYFQTRVVEEVTRAARYKQKLSMIFCDIDHFKKVNDTYGHRCGDQVLQISAGLLRGAMDDLNVISRLRKSDIIARYGGEEFVVILPETEKEGAAIAAEKLRKLIEEYEFEIDGTKLHITMSFGVAELEEGNPDPSRIIKSADEAMYKAKAEGRNRVEVYG